MIHTKLLTIDTTAWPLETAHVLEHWWIDEYQRYLTEQGVAVELSGWFSGSTFEDRIFIETGFYSKTVAALFDTFTTLPLQPKLDYIEHAITTVECEEKRQFNAQDKELLSCQIMSLHSKRLKWSRHLPQLAELFIPSSKPAAKHFRDTSVLITAKKLDDNQQKVFLRLRPIIGDILLGYLEEKFRAYPLGMSDVVKTPGSDEIGLITAYTIPRIPGSLKDIAVAIENLFKTYRVEKHADDFKAHFDGFAAEPLWADAPAEYYRNTGIVTTRNEIRELATPERIAAIFQALSIRAHTTRATEQRYLS